MTVGMGGENQAGCKERRKREYMLDLCLTMNPPQLVLLLKSSLPTVLISF